MGDAILPILTLVLGQLLGYWFATRGTPKRIAAEKRAEYVSGFIGQAYHNLRFLFSAEAAKGAGEAAPQLAVLGNQAAFFLSDEAAARIDKLTSQFASALGEVISPDPGRNAGRVWNDHKRALDALCAFLRRELDASPPRPLRLPWAKSDTNTLPASKPPTPQLEAPKS
jgi:hypothetical protein